MYEDLTPEVLRARMLAAATGGISTEEGSFASDVYAPMSVEAYKIYGNIDMAIDSFFVQSSQGQYLDDAGAQVGVERRPGTNATGTVAVTGTTGATVPAGTLFTTNEGLQFAADAAVTLADGTAQVEARARAGGGGDNNPAGEGLGVGSSGTAGRRKRRRPWRPGASTTSSPERSCAWYRRSPA